MLWLIIAFIAIAVIYKNINKEEDWAESIGFTIALLLLTSWIWIPVTEKIPAPGSHQTITYQAISIHTLIMKCNQKLSRRLL